MEFKVFFTAKDVTTNLEAIQEAGNILVSENKIDPAFIEACIEREKVYPTGLELVSGGAVGMPHGAKEYVLKDSISVIRTNNPVIFGRMEDPDLFVDCNLIFNLAISAGNKHLDILKRLMELLQNQEFVDQCLNGNPDELGEYINQQLILEDEVC